jgi:hypothetical protein
LRTQRPALDWSAARSSHGVNVLSRPTGLSPSFQIQSVIHDGILENHYGGQ